MPADRAAPSPLRYITRPDTAASARVTGVARPARSQRLPLEAVGNAQPPTSRLHRAAMTGMTGDDPALRRHAAPRPRVRRLLPTLPPTAPEKVRFQRLLDASKLTLTDASDEALRALRAEVWTGTLHGRPLSGSDRSCLAAGLTLQLLQQSGVWNEGIGDLLPLIVNVLGWPPGRALRIVDSDHDAIHLYRPGQPELCHRNGGPELPAPTDDEIILLRHDRHFNLIRRDQDPVIEQVPDDGDCFFHCISRALDANDAALSTRRMRAALAEHIWRSPELLQVAGAEEGRLPDRAPPRVPSVSCIPPPPREASSTSTEPVLCGTVLPEDSCPKVTPRSASTALAAYREPVDRLIRAGVHAPAVLQPLHQHHSAHAPATVYSKRDAPWSAQAQQAQQEIDTAFAGYKATNTRDLDALQGTISALHDKAVTTYMTQIEAAMDARSRDKKLAAAQARIRAAVERDFCAAIRETVGTDEALAEHLAKVRADIEAYWTDSVIPRAVNSQRVARRPFRPGASLPGPQARADALK